MNMNRLINTAVILIFAIANCELDSIRLSVDEPWIGLNKRIKSYNFPFKKAISYGFIFLLLFSLLLFFFCKYIYRHSIFANHIVLQMTQYTHDVHSLNDDDDDDSNNEHRTLNIVTNRQIVLVTFYGISMRESKMKWKKNIPKINNSTKTRNEQKRIEVNDL